jgi:DNA ligase (NAD+)
MLSLENAYSWEEAQAWLARAARALGAEPTGFVVELKIDGLSIACATRAACSRAPRGGTGPRRDVTGWSARSARSPPVSSRRRSRSGEVYYSKKPSARIRREAEEAALREPRNAAASTLRLLDSRVTGAPAGACYH